MTPGMPQPGGMAALFQNGADALLKEPQREAVLSSSGIPRIVVKAGIIQDVPGGSSRVRVVPHMSSSSSSSTGTSQRSSISREDLASALVASAVYLPGFGSSSSSAGAGAGVSQLEIQVSEDGPGQTPEDWQALLEGLLVAPAV